MNLLLTRIGGFGGLFGVVVALEPLGDIDGDFDGDIIPPIPVDAGPRDVGVPGVLLCECLAETVDDAFGDANGDSGVGGVDEDAVSAEVCPINPSVFCFTAGERIETLPTAPLVDDAELEPEEPVELARRSAVTLGDEDDCI